MQQLVLESRSLIYTTSTVADQKSDVKATLARRMFEYNQA